MTIDLKEPRNGKIGVLSISRDSEGPSVIDRTNDVPVPRGETHYFIIEFPSLPAYEEPDTNVDVSFEDLRSIAQRHAVIEESIDPDSGWPEGWR